MTTLRAGLIGLGAMGRHHARVLQQLDGVELVGVYDPADDPAGHVDRSLLVPSLDDLVGLDLDYCVVAAPTEAHVDLAGELARRGVAILVEKPIADTYASGLELLNIVKEAGVVAGVGHIERFNIAAIEMRDRIAAGELGEAYQIATRRQGPYPERIRDVGVVLDLATHDLHLASWIGASGHEVVSAQSTHRSGRTHEDAVVINGRLGNGIIVSHIVNWLTPFKERTVMAVGDRGALVADTLTEDLTFIENPLHPTDWDTLGHFRGVAEGNRIRYALPKREPLMVEHEDFRDAVKTGGPAGVPLEEGLQVVRVAEAVLASAREGGASRRLGSM